MAASTAPVAVGYRETLDYWKDFDLTGKRESLDAEAISIAEAQEHTSSSRKLLAERTKEFKKLEDFQRLPIFGPLLKAYQKLVDDVTHRAKESEKSFLGLYQVLNKAPDPRYALELGLEAGQVTELQAENARLEEKIREYREDIEEVQNQDVTIRNLEDKLKQYEVEMEQRIEAQVNQREVELKEELTAAYTALRAREQELDAHFQAVDVAIQGAQQSKESAEKQLVALRLSLDEERASKQRESELMGEGYIERSMDEAVQILLKNKQFVSEGFAPVPTTDGDNTVASLQTQIRQQESLIDALQDQLVEDQNQSESRYEALQVERRRLEGRCESLDETILQLREHISALPSVEEHCALEKKLKTLQATTVDAVEGHTDGDTTLEALLMQKNRKLGVELTRLRQEMDESNAVLTATRDALESEKETNESLSELVKKLEDDLTAGTLPSPVKPQPHSVDDQSDLLRIVTNQRDRFRARVEEVEAAIFTLKRDVNDRDRQITQLREDNVKLFEKIRFLQSYKGEDTEAGNSVGDVAEARYRGMYEERMNPFAAFSKKEKQRRVGQLGTTDRVTLSVGEFVLSRKPIRTFIFFYALLLHLLVFFTLYYVAHFRCPAIRNDGLDTLD